MAEDLVVVAGAGGFVGSHLVARLRKEGRRVRAVDKKPLTEWFQRFGGVDEVVTDLSRLDQCHAVCADAQTVYQLAADMGGCEYIERNKALCMLSVLIDTHMLQAASQAEVERFFYSSSACVYNITIQQRPDARPLQESDAYPAMPEDGYGWEKLFAERLCRHFREDFGLHTCVARYHNVYGPFGEWVGGREKAPAAICRKVIEAKANGSHEIEIWGDGRQTRSFMHIDDCVEGTRRIVDGDVAGPVNLGSTELVTIDELVSLVEEIAGVTLTRRYVTNAPVGVAGRNSDNTMLRQAVAWEPSIALREGMDQTYAWIHDQYVARRGA